MDRAWTASGSGADKGLALDAVFSSPESEVARAAQSAFMPASTTKLHRGAALRTFGPGAPLPHHCHPQRQPGVPGWRRRSAVDHFRPPRDQRRRFAGAPCTSDSRRLA